MKKKLFIFILTGTFIIMLSGMVQGYSLDKSWGSPSAAIRLRVNTASFLYSGSINNAMAAWTATPTPVSVIADNSSDSKIFTVADSGYGSCQKSGANFIITLNTTTLNSQNSDFRKGVLVHEIGHILCLNDINDAILAVTNPSIMNYQRNRNVMNVPQQDDINGVNAVY